MNRGFGNTLLRSRNSKTCCVLLIATGLLNAVVQADTKSMHQSTLQDLRLRDGELVEVSFAATASGTTQIVVPINGVPETIELTPISNRSPEYRVLVQLPNGTYQQATPTPEHAYRGTVVGIEGSIVAATINGAAVRGSIHMPNQFRRWIEPVEFQTADGSPQQHIVYTDEDLVASPDTCAEPIVAPHSEEVSNGSVAGSGPGLYVAELALDADYEYYLQYGDVSAVQDQINTVINTMNVEYERDVQIRHVISTIIVRTTAADPYSSTDSSILLAQFRTQWINNHSGIRRDVAQLFTGKDLNDNIIGAAYLGEVCTSMAYGIVESNYGGCAALACKTDLSAHELGHNWNAEHCSCANPAYTMNPSITGANRFHPSLSIPAIQTYRDTRGCLDIGDELLRITLSVPSTTFDVGQAVQFQAIADFRYGFDEDVTLETTWFVDRPEFAYISEQGLLVLLAADAESCVTVNASYTHEGVTKTAHKQITVIDPTDQFYLVSSNPPAEAIDARRPTYPGGSTAAGWNFFELTLNSEPCTLSPSRFTILQEGGTAAPPAVAAVTQVGGTLVRLTLDKPIVPGTWTTIEDTLSDIALRVGYLPGDVNGNGITNPADILSLIDGLNGILFLPMWSGDLDRSDIKSPADIIELIDMLNGANGHQSWNGVSLP